MQKKNTAQDNLTISQFASLMCIRSCVTSLRVAISRMTKSHRNIKTEWVSELKKRYGNRQKTLHMSPLISVSNNACTVVQ